MIISDRIACLAESQSLQMAARSQQLRAQGIDVISMSLGEPDQDTPLAIQQAAQEAVANHWSHYGPVRGLPALREAVAKQQNEKSSISYSAEDVIVSVGAKMAIYNAIQTLINPGDEVILPTPCWVSYSEMVKVAEGRVVNVATRIEDRYCLTAQQLQAALTPRTKLLILCSPNNPTGSVYSRAQLEALVAVLRDHPQVAVLADEIYSPITYGASPVSLAAFPELAERLIIVNGVSKAYAMTGYRIGWLLCRDKAFVSACARLQGQQVTCATMVAQKAAEVALTGSQECVEQLRQVFAERRALICRLAAEIDGWRFDQPEGAFYLFPDVTALFGKTLRGRLISNADELVEYLLDEAHVACVSGSAFGCDRCIRLSYAISTEEIQEAMRRIQEAING